MKKRLTLFVVILFSSCAFAFAQVSVSGLVKDEQGVTIPSATVKVKGTDVGVATDVNGKYSINVPANGILQFSVVGYVTQEVAVNNRTQINVTLVSSTKQLGEVVVVGYGTQKKSDITSAIATVSTKDIATRPLVNPQEALIGKAAGVQVSIPSGEPGNDMSVRIRGIGSPNGGEPLYVVDGALANDIKTIDPNSIESISILKDASATGIYGAAGSTNGVVMITTKHGAKGSAAKVDVSFYTGFQQIAKKLPVLNNQQWLDLETDIFGTAPTIPPYYDLTNTNNNWQNLIYHNAVQTGVNVGLSGGSETGTYYFNAGYLNQDGIMVGSNFKRFSAKLSLDQNPNKWLGIGGNINYNRSNQRTVPQNASSANGGAVIAALVTPEFVPVTMPANSPNPGVYGYSTFFSGDNPLSDIYNNDNNTLANNLLGDAHVEIRLPYNIKYRSQYNVILENSNYEYFLDPFNNLYGITLQGQGRQSYNETFRWSWDNTLTYDKKFGQHSLNVVVGTSALDEKIFFESQSGVGFASSAIHTLNAASSQFAIGTSRYEWSNNSYFGRAMYNYADRYLLTATLRADGSSRVGVNNKWGTFPAFSAGWKVSNEDFMKDVNWVQDLKVRAGWGETGNLPPYSILYPSYFPLNSNSYAYGSGSSSPGVTPGFVDPNKELKWETAQQTNIGFDASFLDRRISISADYYYKKVKDMIFTQQLPLTTGGHQTAVNLPGYDINKGFEFNINATAVRKTDFTWDMNLNMSFNTNKITGLDTSITYQTGGISIGGSKAPIYTGVIKNGYPLGTFWGYVAQGVDPQTGNMVYSAQQTNLGSALPKFTYGIAQNFRYQSFTLQLLFDGVYGNKVYDATRMETEPLSGYANESASVLARWKKPGDVTSIPTAINNGTTNSGAANLLQSQIASNYIESGSYFRLRNATLGYNFDHQLIQKIGLSSLRVFVTGQNLFTVTKYKGYSPDVNSFGNGTNNKPVNAGDGTASLMALGIDHGAYPAARIYTIGLNVQL